MLHDFTSRFNSYAGDVINVDVVYIELVQHCLDKNGKAVRIDGLMAEHITLANPLLFCYPFISSV